MLTVQSRTGPCSRASSSTATAPKSPALPERPPLVPPRPRLRLQPCQAGTREASNFTGTVEPDSAGLSTPARLGQAIDAPGTELRGQHHRLHLGHDFEVIAAWQCSSTRRANRAHCLPSSAKPHLFASVLLQKQKLPVQKNGSDFTGSHGRRSLRLNTLVPILQVGGAEFAR